MTFSARSLPESRHCGIVSVRAFLDARRLAELDELGLHHANDR